MRTSADLHTLQIQGVGVELCVGDHVLVLHIRVRGGLRHRYLLQHQLPLADHLHLFHHP